MLRVARLAVVTVYNGEDVHRQLIFVADLSTKCRVQDTTTVFMETP